MEYAIKINGMYFKEYIYLDENNKGRYTGHSAMGVLLYGGDVVDIDTTPLIDRTFSRRSVGNTINLLYQIPKLRNSTIKIIPIVRCKKMNHCIYHERGYSSREDYLYNLAEEHDIDYDTVFMLADLLGESEDFDGLVSACQDAEGFECLRKSEQ